jgi:hypothetical protein
MYKSLILAFVLAACTADAPAPTTDAAGSGSDTNLPIGAKCNTPSDTSTECTSGVCTNSFDTLGYSICSQKCTMLMNTDPSCPQGTSQKCNMKGYCKP